MSETPFAEHFNLDVDPAAKLVKLVRTTVHFRTVGEMIEVLEGIMTAVKDLDGSSYGLVVDNRALPPRTDPGFVEAFASFRKLLSERFVRVGVLLRTDAGIQQHDASAPSENVRASTSEEAAIAWATRGIEPSS